MRAASDQLGIARGTIYSWIKPVDAFYAFNGNAELKTLKGQELKEIFHGVLFVVTCMKDVRRRKQVRTSMVSYLCMHMY